MYSNKTKNILCIEGGGSRGVIPYVFLDHLKSILFQKQIDGITVFDNVSFSKYFDYFTGSSVGVILICACLLPDPKDQDIMLIDSITIDAFIKLIQSVFYSSYLYSIRSAWGIRLSSYDHQHKLTVFKQIFGTYKIKDLVSNIIIPIFDMISDECIFITKDSFPELSIVDLLMAATAAPTFFDPWEIKYNDRTYLFVDNGIINNNPSSLCLTYIAGHSNTTVPYVLVSIGTGQFKISYQTKNKNWGLLGWSSHIVNLKMSTDNVVEQYKSSTFLKDNFINLNFPIYDPTLYKLDITNTSQILQLKKLTEEYIKNNPDVFKNIIDKINPVQACYPPLL